METILLVLILTGVSKRLRACVSKIDFPVGTGIHILPCNLNLNMEKTVEYNNKILINNVDMKTGFNKNINKVLVYQNNCPSPDQNRVGNKFVDSTDNLIKETTLLTDNRKMLVEKYNDSNHYTFVKTGLLTYHFFRRP